MKYGPVKLLLLWVVILSNFIFFNNRVEAALGSDPVSNVARNLVDESRWIIILSGEESGHGHIKSIIKERYREDLFESGTLRKTYEYSFHCECQTISGVLYILDSYYKWVRIEGDAIYICPKNQACKGHTYRFIEDFYDEDESVVIYPNIKFIAK